MAKCNKDQRLGLRMSQADMDALEIARQALGLSGRAEVVRMLVRMFVAPLQAQMSQQNVTTEQALKAVQQVRIDG